MAHIAEEQELEFSLEEVQSMRFRASRTLLGRLFTSDQITTLELRDGLLDSWQLCGQLKVSNAKHGLFEIVLPNEEAKKWALARTPWIIKDKLLTLRSWSPTITKQHFEEMAVAPFRIQIWGVQEDCRTKLFGQKLIASTVGQVLDSNLFASKETGEHFIKVRAMVDFSKPLRSQLMAVSEETDGFWVSLKYEFLPSFCFHCGRVVHARRDYVFDPPRGKERFGPHMTTKKLGHQIYDDDGHSMAMGGPRSSVWINRQTRGADAANWRKKTNDNGEKGRFQTVVPTKWQQEAPFAAGRGLEIRSDNGMQVEREQESSPLRRHSPRGFVINRTPKLKLGGGGKQKRRASIKEHDSPALRGKKGGRRPPNPKQKTPTKAVAAQAEVMELSRRRLILEEDSDDDMEDPSLLKDHGMPQCLPGDLATQQGSDRPERERWRPRLWEAVGIFLVLLGRGRRAVPCMVRGAMHVVGRMLIPPAVHNQVLSAGMANDGNNNVENGVAVSRPRVSGVAISLGNASHGNSDSEESGRDDEHHCFEIKKRVPRPVSVDLVRGMVGKVSQVVAAFEAGMAIAQDNEVPLKVKSDEKGSNDPMDGRHEQGAEFLDEYGSNMTNLVLETHKRSLAAVEGEVGSPPTPKKHFVEVDDVYSNEKVEEASLEWPQSDK
ncbi:unnamed protein product [Linum trigynum]|uniref:DUF4283 domain-containing protein n=1 Tax=Linum trigynum TaxID=586398 RepID=A0AAV2GE94_9ROSI